MSACAECTVREKAICQSLTMDELKDLNSFSHHMHVKRGQTLAWQGDESLLVGNVIEGVLKLSFCTEDGREQTLGVMFPSDFMGRPFGPQTSHSIVALTDAQVCTFRRSAFDDFARGHPDLEHKLLKRTLKELDRTRHWMFLLGRKSAYERIASFLLDMTRRLAGPVGASERSAAEFELPFSRQEIADLLGLTIETVSRQFRILRDEGLIETTGRRRVRILDPDRLEACAQD